MKKSILLLLSACFLLNATAQQVEETQRTIITKRSATWCPPCGGWGWTFFEELITDNDDKAILIAAHHSGLLATDAGKEMTDNWGAFSQPRFFLNEVDQSATSSNYESLRTSIKSAVDAAYELTPVANMGFQPVYDNGAIQVDATIRFFQPADGEFYAGIYLIENGVVEFQENQGPDAIHDKVFRQSFTASTWGEIIANGAVADESVFTKSFSLPIGNPAGYNYEIVGIIWKKEGDLYIPVNAWANSDITTATAVRDTEPDLSMSVTPTVTSTSATLQFDLKERIGQVSISLLHSGGQLAKVIYKGSLEAGPHRFEIDADQTLSRGLYYVRFTDGKQVVSKKLLLQ